MKLGAAMAALVFMLLFGAVGVFASWAIGSAVVEGYAARSWVRVKAELVKYGSGELQYRYRVGDRDYNGTTLGVGLLQPSEIDEEIDARFTAAFAEKKPVTVFVDPERPEKSVVDPSIPWKMTLFMLPFALGFGGVGLGAGYVLVRSLMPERAEEPKPTVAAGPGAGAMPLWAFAFFWNAVSFPIALIAVPDIIRTGDYFGLLVLIFPLIGLFILWAAVKSTWTALFKGGAGIEIQNAPRRLGEIVSGQVTFKRGVAVGDAFKARLACMTTDEGSPLVHWKLEKDVRVAQGPQSMRILFSFDTPARLPSGAGERDEPTDWRLELYSAGRAEPVYAFAFELLPPLGAEHESEVEQAAMLDEEDQLAAATPLPAGVQSFAQMVGAEHKLAAMTPAERAQFKARLDAMTPEQRAALDKLGNYAHLVPLLKKLFFWAIGLFIAVQVLGVVAAFMFAS